jgi:flagellar hook-basal body complex protein FliE
MTVPLSSVNRLLPGIAQQAGRQLADEVQHEAKTDGSFTDLFSKLISSVNDLHKESAQIQEAFLSGEPVELHQVMIKAEEAGLATDLLLEIRNRIVNAYNELLRMPV